MIRTAFALAWVALVSTAVSAQTPAELEHMLGTFEGEWTMSALDPDGQPVERFSWTDSLVAHSPTVESGKIYVTATGYMRLAPGAPPRVMEWTEGYLMDTSGAAGDQFMEIAGQLVLVHEVGPETYAHVTEPAPGELARLGLPADAVGHHATVKSVVYPDGVETHLVTRTTAAEWEEGGAARAVQFVSLRGVHRRVD